MISIIFANMGEIYILLKYR